MADYNTTKLSHGLHIISPYQPLSLGISIQNEQPPIILHYIHVHSSPKRDGLIDFSVEFHCPRPRPLHPIPFGFFLAWGPPEILKSGNLCLLSLYISMLWRNNPNITSFLTSSRMGSDSVKTSEVMEKLNFWHLPWEPHTDQCVFAKITKAIPWMAWLQTPKLLSDQFCNPLLNQQLGPRSHIFCCRTAPPVGLHSSIASTFLKVTMQLIWFGFLMHTQDVELFFIP